MCLIGELVTAKVLKIDNGFVEMEHIDTHTRIYVENLFSSKYFMENIKDGLCSVYIKEYDYCNKLYIGILKDDIQNNALKEISLLSNGYSIRAYVTEYQDIHGNMLLSLPNGALGQLSDCALIYDQDQRYIDVELVSCRLSMNNTYVILKPYSKIKDICFRGNIRKSQEITDIIHNEVSSMRRPILGSVIETTIQKILPYGIISNYNDFSVLTMITDTQQRLNRNLLSVGDKFETHIFHRNYIPEDNYRGCPNDLDQKGPLWQLAKMNPNTVFNGKITFISGDSACVELENGAHGYISLKRIETDVHYGDILKVMIKRLTPYQTDGHSLEFVPFSK